MDVCGCVEGGGDGLENLASIFGGGGLDLSRDWVLKTI